MIQFFQKLLFGYSWKTNSKADLRKIIVDQHIKISKLEMEILYWKSKANGTLGSVGDVMEGIKR